MKPVILDERAVAEAAAAAAYYNDVSSGLGDAFAAALEVALSQIEQHPRIGAPMETGDMRRFRLSRFPYIVFYLELDDTIWVAAVAHTSRRPGYWRDRQPSER